MTPSTALRVAAVLAATCGVATLAVAGVVGAPANVVTVLLVACAAVMSARLTTPAETTLRRRCAVVVLACASVAALVSTRGEVATSTMQVLGLLLCAAAVTHSLVIDTVRDARVNTGISVSMLVLAAGLAPGLSIAVPLVATWACAVTALVLAARDAEGSSADAIATTDAAPATFATPVATAVAVTLLAGLAVALVLPHPSGLSARTGFGSAAAGAGKAVDGRAAVAYLGGAPLSLDARGQLSHTPVALVSTDHDALWQAATLTSYDGHSWSSPQGPGVVLEPTSVGDPQTVRIQQPKGSTSPAPGPERTDVVGWVAPTATVVIAPGVPTRVETRGGTQVVQEADGRIALVSGGDTTYRVTSDTVPDVDAGAHATGGADLTSAEYLALPGSVPSRVHDLAATITAGAADRATAVRAVESYLRSHESYDLDSPVTPATADSVDDFLFRTHRGFCEHFASAEVVLLRSAGIPARLATGFADGSPDGSGRRVIVASDAHAWVQVWLPGTGWANSDPTAGSSTAAGHRSGLAALQQRLARAVGDSAVHRIGIAVLLVGLAALATKVPSRRRRERARPARTPSTPLFAAFHRLEQALAATGRARQDAETVRALAARLHATDDVVGALRVVERASYAEAGPDGTEAWQAAETLDGLTAALLREPSSP